MKQLPFPIVISKSCTGETVTKSVSFSVVVLKKAGGRG